MYEKMIQIDPNAPTEEEHIAKGVTKPRYMVSSSNVKTRRKNQLLNAKLGLARNDFEHSQSRFSNRRDPERRLEVKRL